jgi:benzoylformate decarboxylase
LEGFGRRFGLEKPVGTRLPGLDFVKIAQAQGVEARQVGDRDALDEALRWSLAAEVPTLLDVIVED